MKKIIFTVLMMFTMILSMTACKDEISQVNSEENIDSHFGQISDNTYANSNLELNATFNEDWIVYSENEILEYNKFSADDVVKEEDIEAGNEFTEIVAYDMDSYDSVFVISEKLEADATIDINAIANADMLENDEYYASVEYTDIVSEVSTVDFLGDERTCIKTNALLDGDNVFICVIYVENNGYLLTFEICSADEAGADAILEAFELK